MNQRSTPAYRIVDRKTDIPPERSCRPGPLKPDGLFGGPHCDWRTINQAAQLAAR